MLGEYKVSRCSRQCYAENRPLREGEWFYSCVVAADEEYERRDYSQSAWEGPPEGCVGHWKSRMPQSGERKLVLAPREVLIELLRQMEEFPQRAKTRYLLALILMRRRFVRLLPEAPKDFVDPDPTGETHWLHLDLNDGGEPAHVAEVTIARSETESLSEAIGELLYCEASEIESTEPSHQQQQG